MASKKNRWNGDASSGNAGRRNKGVLFAGGCGARLLGDEADTSITLKNGARVPVGGALASYDTLKSMLDNDTEHFKAIRAIASGRSSEISKSIIKDLRDAGFLTPSGDLKPSTRDVFVSSYLPTPEGDVMTPPFAPASEREKRLLEDREALYNRRLKKLARELKPDDSGPSL